VDAFSLLTVDANDHTGQTDCDAERVEEHACMILVSPVMRRTF